MELLLIRYEHILQLEALSPHHPDPFDRLLAAQSVVEKRAILPVTKSSRIILSS
jgi:PIN domain nuclease of toxin-antitoxin system